MKMNNRRWFWAMVALIILTIATKGGILVFVGIGWGVYAIRQHVMRQRIAQVKAAAIAETSKPPVLTRGVQRPPMRYMDGKIVAGVDSMHIRVTTAQREAVVEELSRQFGVGTLDQETFDKRMSSALSATQQYELDILVSDLPVLSLPCNINEGPQSNLGGSLAFRGTLKPQRLLYVPQRASQSCSGGVPGSLSRAARNSSVE